ncbi:hypothetical protein SAMN02745136_05247 [Anaerocolumna jejuensis DSM 15929]|uniref:Zinc-ribbon domain-containing protein n=1 Tax=Anaerocolumna jejuensis DSM 15929 TaxID=1121322 RepID=A0A1M7BUH3_9FIRM|nr:hypothetical protein [Anaerocolumna jejuensis]SHL58516.1 hypothetical protein SAMN02745136_05247 [Anaerocolumna jejuensis DSM 15929]
MYCVKCGVELSENQKKCPLCDTVVYHPDIHLPEGHSTYPVLKKETGKIKPGGVLMIISFVFALAYLLTLFVDIKINTMITWSGYGANAIFLLYVWGVLPFWSKRPNPVILIPINFIAAGIYLAYIDFTTEGHWFWGFALPVIAVLTVSLTVLAALIQYLRKGYLYIASGIWFIAGTFILMLEALINRNFKESNTFIWALYPFITCCMIGTFLIVIAICQPLRVFLYKRFFI